MLLRAPHPRVPRFPKVVMPQALETIGINHKLSALLYYLTERIQAQIDLAISLILYRWPVLNTAVTHQWGGPDAASKRDWLAGSISDLFLANPTDTYQEDVEFRLLDVLETEFEVNLEDESELEVASEICRVRKMCLEGDFGEVERLRRQWEGHLKRKGGAGFVIQAGKGVEFGDKEEEDSWDEDENEEEEGGVRIAADGDIEMGDATQPNSTKGKPKIEVDGDGFTKVVSKKKR